MPVACRENQTLLSLRLPLGEPVVSPVVGGGPGHRFICFTNDVPGKMIVVETRIPNGNFGRSMCVACMSTVSMKAL